MLTELFIFLFCSYLLGSIVSSVLLCRLYDFDDPRKIGSRSSGATNTLRTGGKKIAIQVLILDVLKGLVVILFGKLLGFEMLHLILAALATMVGHAFPIFFQFKGGKGVATWIGALLALELAVGIAFLGVWLSVFLIFKISSLSALIATLLTPLFFYILHSEISLMLAFLLPCSLIFFTHWSNITRLYNGVENQSMGKASDNKKTKYGRV